MHASATCTHAPRKATTRASLVNEDVRGDPESHRTTAVCIDTTHLVAHIEKRGCRYNFFRFEAQEKASLTRPSSHSRVGAILTSIGRHCWPASARPVGG